MTNPIAIHALPAVPSPTPPAPSPAELRELLAARMRDALAFDADLQNRYAYLDRTGRWPDDEERERIRAEMVRRVLP